MQGFDVNRFVQERTASWGRLEQLLQHVEDAGLSSLNLAGAREFGKLYRAVSSDLIRARTEQVNATVVDYLNDIVARSYAVLYTAQPRPDRRVLRFLLEGYPRLVRREWRPIVLSATIFFLGAAIGAAFVVLDPASLGALIPEGHQAHTPGERVGRDELTGGGHGADEATAFSAFLFTHNIQVTFVVFALGITGGVGTVALLFRNGVPLGALAAQYHQGDLGTFFWAWILPHGIPELTVVWIAGGAGLIIARGLWMPGRRRRRDALVAEARTAAALIMGSMPLLVFAGLIEGTISQIHEPTLPYAAKLLFAVAAGTGVYAYLLRAGRQRAETSEAARSRAPRSAPQKRSSSSSP
ncbi:MAG: stage II sporulation protein M [Myxococcales bacterium]